MTGKEDNYRGPAVRALCQITDVSLLPLSSHLPFPAFNQGSVSPFACFRLSLPLGQSTEPDDEGWGAQETCLLPPRLISPYPVTCIPEGY